MNKDSIKIKLREGLLDTFTKNKKIKEVGPSDSHVANVKPDKEGGDTDKATDKEYSTMQDKLDNGITSRAGVMKLALGHDPADATLRSLDGKKVEDDEYSFNKDEVTAINNVLNKLNIPNKS